MPHVGYGHIFQDKKVRERMFRLYLSGKSTVELGIRFGCDHTSIMYQVKKHGIWTGKPRIYNLRVQVKKAKKFREIRMKEAVVIFDTTPVKQYKDYIAEQKERDKKYAILKEARMRRAREEKKKRDSLMKRGLLPTFKQIEEDMVFNI